MTTAAKKKKKDAPPRGPGWLQIKRPTSWATIAVLRAAIADLEGGRRPDLVRSDLLRALEER